MVIKLAVTKVFTRLTKNADPPILCVKNSVFLSLENYKKLF